MTWSDVFIRDQGHCRYCGADLLSSVSAFCGATLDATEAKGLADNERQSHLILACSSCVGLLSRATPLRTFKDRSAFLSQQWAKAAASFQDFNARLREPDQPKRSEEA
jgi:5-methylcytosine-specific restriction endonuclease McrA